MTDGVSLVVRRKDDLFRFFRKAAPAAVKQLMSVNEATAYDMAASARSFVKVVSGDLHDSITVTPPGGIPPSYSQGIEQGAVPEGAYMVTAGNTKVRYPHLVEFGTAPHYQPLLQRMHPGTPAQPFFFPAYRLARRKFRAKSKRAIRMSFADAAR